MPGSSIARATVAAAAAAVAAAAPASAQQKVVPPDTVYWMSASTQTGLPFSPGGAAPSPADMMRMAMGGGAGGPLRLLHLDLGSRRTPRGAPEAAHAIPPAMRMGASLPLVTPRRPPPAPPADEELDFERPRGRLLLFWGCGETARPGQPVVIDFAKVAAGQIPPGLFAGERVRVARPPAPGRWPVTGHWPNETPDGRRSVPAGASLIGDHRVSGSYPPEIRFALQQDWMAPVSLRQAPRSSPGTLFRARPAISPR